MCSPPSLSVCLRAICQSIYCRFYIIVCFANNICIIAEYADPFYYKVFILILVVLILRNQHAFYIKIEERKTYYA